MACPGGLRRKARRGWSRWPALLFLAGEDKEGGRRKGVGAGSRAHSRVGSYRRRPIPATNTRRDTGDQHPEPAPWRGSSRHSCCSFMASNLVQLSDFISCSF
jgi:hypothetical protein